ncbi:MAG: hypothetical protein WC314_14765 [Vulcanimicrobiota bacterium]
MLSLDDIPPFQQKDLSWGLCGLEITRLNGAASVEEAWQLLPDTCEGVVTLADAVRRYNPKKREGLLLDAEVVDGQQTTVVRSQGLSWSGWRWEETKGDSHRYVEYTFLSSEPGTKPPHLIYRQYWTKQADGDLQVWQPVGARFCGFREASK